MHNVHIVELFPDGTPSKWFSSRKGRFLNLPTLQDPLLEFELEDVTVTYWDREQQSAQSQVMKFREQEPFVYRRDMSEEIGLDRKRIKEMSISDMKTLLANNTKKTNRLRSYSKRRMVLELNRRVVLSFAPLAFVFLCVPLSMMSGDQTKVGGVGMIVISCLVLFYPAHIFAVRYGETSNISPILLCWPPVLLFLVAGVLLIRKQM